MNEKQHINRWIFASVAKHFDDRKEDIYLHIDGMIRQTNHLPEYAELKIDGPYTTELSRGYFHLLTEVNVSVQAQCSETDAHNWLKLLGVINKSFTRCIPVYRYGNGVDDDNSFVGVLKLKHEFRQRTDESHFGQTKPSENIRQQQIEGHYEMHLEMQSD